jgi:hypothetical protein
MPNENIESSQGAEALHCSLTAPVVNQPEGSEFQPQAKGIAQNKVGRNAPCPCGSAKKYKKCHGLPQVSRLVGNPRLSIEGNTEETFANESPTTYVFVFGELPTGTRDLFVTDEPDFELQEAIAWFESNRTGITYGIVKAKYDLMTRRVVDVERLVGKKFEGLGPQRSAVIKDIQDGFDLEDVHDILADKIKLKRELAFLQRRYGATCHFLGQEPQFSKKKGTEKRTYRPSKRLTNEFPGLKKTNLDYTEPKETDKDNIVYYIAPSGEVLVGGYMVINKTTNENYVIPSVRIHLEDWWDKLQANGSVRPGDTTEVISFIYDITSLKVQLFRKLDLELGWSQPPQNPEFIKGLERFLRPFGESWKALYESAGKAA